MSRISRGVVVTNQITQAGQTTTATRTTQMESPDDSPYSPSHCPECGAQVVSDAGTGDTYCEECGLVIDETQLERSEPGWRDAEDRRTSPTTGVTREHVGTRIGHTETNQNARWRFIVEQNQRLEYFTQALQRGLREVRRLCSGLQLGRSTLERAAYLYRSATEADLLQGRSREAIAGGCVYAATREHSDPVTMADIAQLSSIEKGRIWNGYRTLLSELDLTLQLPDPRVFLPRIRSAADLPFHIQSEARTILTRVINANDHTGQKPTGVAAAALYAAARAEDIDCTQAALAEAADVSTVTTSRQYQSIKPHTDGD